MVKVHALPVHGNDPGMPRNLGAPVKNHQLRRTKRNPNGTADETRRNRVGRHPHPHQTRPAHPRRQRQSWFKPFERDRRQQRALHGEVLSNRPYPVADSAALIVEIPLPDSVVEVGERINDGHRREMSAAEPADFPLDPPFS